ncbi:MAG: helix-turn-helix domain-containing protein [Patescibacteria group bacterium]
MTQETALAILKTGANVFLTGEPGSGKTHTINRYVEYLREHGIEPAITASTGIAATHIGGMTIHSWSGIGIRKSLSKQDLDQLAHNKKAVSRMTRTDILIIEEISMLDASTLSAVEAACRAVRKKSAPFGGMHVILVGDFFQLPPISREGEPPARFAYLSPSWQEANLTVCYLSEQHRQDDDRFLTFLTSLRMGNITDESHALLVSRQIRIPATEAHTKLYSHNLDVDRVNREKLAALPGAETNFQMNTRGQKRFVEQLIKNCLSPELLLLKVGARVMFTKNNFPEGFVNGTLGDVIGFDDEGRPVVQTRNGKKIHATPMEWTLGDGMQTLAKIIQLPLRLAWAITIHKSQGMTLDAASMDLSDAFEYGQGYVALSRVRSLAGLYLVGYNERALQVHPEILATDATFREQASNAEVLMARLSPEERADLQKKFIIACDGSFDTAKVAEKRVRATRSGKAKKNMTYLATLELFRQSKTIPEIATARGLAESTIAGHIEKLYLDGKLEKSEIMKIVPEWLIEVLPKIHQAFRESKDGKLAPVFAQFAGTYSYSELRLARMLL